MKFNILAIAVLAVTQHVQSLGSLSLDMVAKLQINPVISLPWNQTTGIFYNAATGQSISNLLQLLALRPATTLAQLNQWFPQLITGITTAPTAVTSPPISTYPINILTGLPYNPLTFVQYNPVTGAPITTKAQAQSIFPNKTQAELALLFPYLYVTDTAVTGVPSLGVVKETLANNTKAEVNWISNLLAQSINNQVDFFTLLTRNLKGFVGLN